MVDIAPFRATRFVESKVGKIANVIAPPYDVITPAMQDALYAQHTCNIVRVDLTRPEAGEPEDARYDRARETMATWLRSGALAEDAEAAFYVLAQSFEGPDGVRRTRTGFFGRARLTAFSEGPILPHERTLRGPKVDRLKLMRATGKNLSPIFGTYRDPEQRVLSVLEEAKRTAPLVEAEMDHVENTLWRIRAPGDQRRIQATLASSKLYIADGHHRYETALAYRDERRSASSRGAPPADARAETLPGYESILMFSAAVEDPGMVIFPTHRLVSGLRPFDASRVFAELDAFFHREPAPGDVDGAVRALREAGTRGHAFIAVTQTERWLLLRKATERWEAAPTLPWHPALRALDVAVLHGLILEGILGISQEAQASQANLRYSKDASEAFSAPARDSDVQLALLMNPTKIDEVLRVAEAGEVMPQKSTFFYPKIPSGLVVYALD